MPTIIKLHPATQMSDDQFFEFCQANSDYRFERTANQEIVVLSPTGSESGQRNANLIVQVGIWAERDGTGVIFGSSTGFTLPNGAVRSPNVAWIQKEQAVGQSVDLVEKSLIKNPYRQTEILKTHRVSMQANNRDSASL